MRLPERSLLTACLVAGLPLFAADGTAYALFYGGSPKGKVVLKAAGEGAWGVDFTRLTRGWKDDLHGEVRLDEEGRPLRLELEGESNSVAGYREVFEQGGGRPGVRAHWSAPGEAGSTTVRGAFYLGAVGTMQPLFTMWLAQALQQASGGAMRLLPVGTARLGKATLLEIPSTRGLTHLRQLPVEGLDYNPALVWFTPGGEPVAAGSDSLLIVREGWEDRFEAFTAAFVAQQKSLDEARGRAARLPSPATYVVRGAAVFDAAARRTLPDQSVVVKDGRIAALGPAARVKVPPGAQVIEARGRTLIPGLWNSHHHVGTGLDQIMAMAAGVTGAHDPGIDPRTGMDVLKACDEGRIPGPRVFPSMLIDGRGPNTAQIAVEVDTPEELTAALDRARREGYFGVKLYGSLKRELVPRIISEARARGLWVGGHVPAGYTALDAVRMGYQEVNHLYFGLLALWPELKEQTNGMARFTAMAERTKDLDPDGPEVQGLLAFLKAHGTVMDPTMVVVEGLLDKAPGTPDLRYGALEPRLPSVVRRQARADADLAATPEERARNRASFLRALAIVKAMHGAGIPVVGGTDGSSLTLPREFALYVKAGIPAPEVLAMATLESARAYGQDKELGSLEVGKWADMALVDGDPSRRIQDLERILWTARGGVRYDREKLLRAIGLGTAKGR